MHESLWTASSSSLFSLNLAAFEQIAPKFIPLSIEESVVDPIHEFHTSDADMRDPIDCGLLLGLCDVSLQHSPACVHIIKFSIGMSLQKRPIIITTSALLHQGVFPGFFASCFPSFGPRFSLFEWVVVRWR